MSETSAMKIRFYNSLTNKLEYFWTVDPGIVRMYSCGPTVYDFAHIGNFRSFLFGDLLRRYLEFVGFDVRQVMNITDVGHMTEGEADKMTEAAQRMKENKKSGRVPEGAVKNPEDPWQIAQYYLDAFLDDSRRLGYKIAYEYPNNVPRATDYIPQMQKLIQRLLDRKHAYVAADGVVYFSVESFPGYGQLSGNTLEKLQSGAGGRVQDENQAMKRHSSDFMLWKPDNNHIMKWESPWGTGYPGWHVECSAMAMDLLESDVIDIHTGGEDLKFPHHECEIAQSCGATGKESFSNFWIHAKFLMVEGEKMSKSKGNFFTARDVFEGKATGKPVHPAVLRYELIKANYRTEMNFTRKSLADSANVVRRLMELRLSLEVRSGGVYEEVDLTHPAVAAFAEPMADDLNIAGALAAVIGWANGSHPHAQESLGVWRKLNSVLSIAPVGEGDVIEDDAGQAAEPDSALQLAEQWCKDLDAARAAKNFSLADELRGKIRDSGFEVRTTKEGTVIQKELI